jgi:enoyl-CoA hydratase
VAVITIDRPEVANAIDRPVAEALADAFRRVESSDRAGGSPSRHRS